jgi:hypothetical protein
MLRRLCLTGFTGALLLTTVSTASAGPFRRYIATPVYSVPSGYPCCPTPTIPAGPEAPADPAQEDPEKVQAAIQDLLKARIPEKEFEKTVKLYGGAYFETVKDAEEFTAKSESDRAAIYAKELVDPTATEVQAISDLLTAGKIDIDAALQIKARAATKRADVITKLKDQKPKPDELTKEEQTELFKVITVKDFETKSGLSAETAANVYSLTPKAKRKDLLAIWK